MKISLYVWGFVALYAFIPVTQAHQEKKMDRIELCKKQYAELFDGQALNGAGNDPELMDILQKYIFGEVFHTGKLDAQTRELITIVSLTAQQTLPQLKAHTKAALNIGVTPIEIREAVYQCAPIIGFPKTLNAVSAMNEVFTEQGISLPLEKQGTVREDERHARGLAIQSPLYGSEIKDSLQNLPAGMGDEAARLLTEVCFGDFYTRKGLDVRKRELLMLCVLATLGADKQISAHCRGNLKAGNDEETMIAAMIQCLPYIGFPYALNAIHAIKGIHAPASSQRVSSPN